MPIDPSDSPIDQRLAITGSGRQLVHVAATGATIGAGIGCGATSPGAWACAVAATNNGATTSERRSMAFIIPRHVPGQHREMTISECRENPQTTIAMSRLPTLR